MMKNITQILAILIVALMAFSNNVWAEETVVEPKERIYKDKAEFQDWRDKKMRDLMSLLVSKVPVGPKHMGNASARVLGRALGAVDADKLPLKFEIIKGDFRTLELPIGRAARDKAKKMIEEGKRPKIDQLQVRDHVQKPIGVKIEDPIACLADKNITFRVYFKDIASNYELEGKSAEMSMAEITGQMMTAASGNIAADEFMTEGEVQSEMDRMNMALAIGNAFQHYTHAVSVMFRTDVYHDNSAKMAAEALQKVADLCDGDKLKADIKKAGDPVILEWTDKKAIPAPSPTLDVITPKVDKKTLRRRVDLGGIEAS